MSDRARHSLQGRKAKAAGSNLESWLDSQHKLALRLGILARIDKIDPPAVVRGGRVEFGPRTGADYIGMLGTGVRSINEGVFTLLSGTLTFPTGYICVEAKSTADDRFYKSEVKPKQQEHLNVVARGGGLALLVVEFRSMTSTPSRFAIPWLKVPWKVQRSAESIGIGSVQDWRVYGECYLECFHPRGVPSTSGEGRVYPKE